MITKDTKISEIVYQYPELIYALEKYSIYCFSWGGAPAWGTLELQARMRAMDNIDEIVKDLNKTLQEHQEGRKKASEM